RGRAEELVCGHGAEPADLVEGLYQAGPVPSRRGHTAGRVEYLGKVGSAEIGHAEHAQTGRGIIADRVHRNDIGVLEPRQDPRLVAFGPRDLDRDESTTQVELFGQVDPGKRSAAEFLEDAKVR